MLSPSRRASRIDTVKKPDPSEKIPLQDMKDIMASGTAVFSADGSSGPSSGVTLRSHEIPTTMFIVQTSVLP